MLQHVFPNPSSPTSFQEHVLIQIRSFFPSAFSNIYAYVLVMSPTVKGLRVIPKVVSEGDLLWGVINRRGR